MFLSLKRTRWLILFALVLAFIPLSIANRAAAQTSTGAGSYTTTLPAGATAPQPTIYKTANVTTKMPTNEWWSSLAWKRYPNASENMLPHPLSVKAKTDGLGLGYPTNQTVTGDGRKYEYVYTEDLTVGVNGLNAAYTDVKVDGFSDWTVSIDWATGQFKATVGHGLPFVYLTKGSGNALVKFNAPPTVQSNSGSAVHVVVNGHAYGLYAPAGSTWTQSGNNFESTLAGKNYYSVAALPDSNAATFNDFKAHAMAFVTGTSVSWSYNPSNSLVSTTYTINTVAKEGTELRTLFALYPHQWLYTAAPNTAYTYVSPRGTMKVVRGTSFATSMKFSGVLPYLPDVGAYDRTKLYNYINDIYALSDDARMNFPGPNGERDTYWTGKGLGRLAMLVPIAEQVGHTAARDSFLATLKSRLQNWYTASAGETGNLFYYDNNWGTLIGYPANYGSETELNDHHFHYAYYVVAAATVALYDHTWSNSTNWGPMTELLIKDAANWDINADPRFPRLRNFDPYEGHSWASGSQAFAAGNNQESSSESMNFNYGLILWGAATGNTTIRDLGIYLYTTEAAAIENYWFDVNNNIFPNTNYSHNYAAMVWSDGASYSTWWTANAEEIHGINILPVTGGSLYLGKYPSYVNGFYQEMVANNGGPEYEWSDIIWEYQAFADPNAAMSKFGTGSYSGLAQEWGETKAHTYHWIGNLQALGTFNYPVTGNAPLSAVFTKNGTNTYVAYNPSGAGVTVTYSNGASLFVPAWSMATSNGVAVPTSTPTITPTPSNTSQYSPTPTRTPTATNTVATFQPPTSTATATATNNTGGFNAYSVIRAEARTSASGVNFETCSEGGQDATNLANGDYLVFDNVNFGSGGVYQVNSRIASGAAGGISGIIEYWIDGLTTAAGGTKLGDFALANTGGWQAWTTTPAGASNATGVHRVYVKFTSGQPADFVNLQWFQFLSSTATVVSTTPASTATPSRTPTRTNTAVPTNTPTRTNTPLPTSTPTATNTSSGSVNPFAQVRAENRTTASGIFFETCSEGGQDAAGIANGDYLSFDNVNFGTGGATRIDSRVASGAAGGVSGIVEYWIDGLTTATGGTKLGDFALSNTGGWQSWTTIPAGTINVTGTHRVYVKFTSGQPADFVNLQWFVFVR